MTGENSFPFEGGKRNVCVELCERSYNGALNLVPSFLETRAQRETGWGMRLLSDKVSTQFHPGAVNAKRNIYISNAENHNRKCHPLLVCGNDANVLEKVVFYIDSQLELRV